MRLIREHATLIINSLANETDKWDVREYVVSLKDTDLEIWIGSTAFFFIGIWKNGEIRPAFNLIEKRLIWNLARPLTMLKPPVSKADWPKFIIDAFKKNQSS